MSTHLANIRRARAEGLCFACTAYAAPLSHLSATCARGGLDPAKTLAMENARDAKAWATVLWNNSCPRFVEVKS